MTRCVSIRRLARTPWKARGRLAIVGKLAMNLTPLHSLQTRGAMSNRVTLEIFSDYI